MRVTLGLILLLLTGCGTTPGISPLPSDSRQALVVQTDSWEGNSGILYRAEKNHGAWQMVGLPIRATLGKNGLAWGVGLHDPYIQDDDSAITTPFKNEGDSRSPAGVFYLGDAFGKSATPPENTVWPYNNNGGDLVCVTDMTSDQYNLVVTDGSGVWDSAQRLTPSKAPYNLFIAINNNSDPVVPGKGSCMFLQTSAHEAHGTEGSTAVDEKALNEILSWLDPDKYPVLVQLPAEIAQSKKEKWGLPVWLE